jgi:hypothetical protein
MRRAIAPEDSTAATRYDFWAVVVPLSIFIEIPLVGRLFFSEVIMLCLLPGLFTTRGSLLAERMPKRVLILGVIWLAFQIYADVVHATPFADWARGWSKIVFFLLNFAGIYLLLVGNARRLALFAWGLVFGGLLQYFFNPSIFAHDYPWKFGVGPSVTLGLVLLSQSPGTPRTTQILIVLFACALNLVLGFRSMAAFCFVTVVFTFGRGWLRKMRAPALVLAFAVSAYSLSALYGYLAEEGLLGHDAKEKYEAQSAGEFGLLLGGRVELFASTQAVIDSPIIGHGSWAKDFRYVELLNERLAEFGYELPIDPESELVPSHSYFMGAWVEAGLGGALFWLWIFFSVSATLVALLRAPSSISGLVVFLGIGLVWAILFSPFGAEARIQAAFVIALMMFAKSGAVSPHGGER